MTEPWKQRLEEVSFEDLSQQEKQDLVQEMESNPTLREKVISDLRFESVLKETLRTHENPEYREKLQQTWSVDQVAAQMREAGMAVQEKHQKSENSPSKLYPFSLVFLAVVTLVLIVFWPEGSGSANKTSQPAGSLTKNEDKPKVIYQDGTGKERVLEVKSGDLLSTGEEGEAQFQSRQGVFIELGKKSKVAYLETRDLTELHLKEGRLTATVTSMTTEGKETLIKSDQIKMLGKGFKALMRNEGAKGTYLKVLEGRLESLVFATQKTFLLKAGEVAQISSSGKVTLIEEDMNPVDVDLVGWWSMDDGQGKIITDFSGHGQKGSLAEHVKLSEGRRGQALMISEISRNNLSIPHSPDLNIHPVDGITVMAWVKTTRTKDPATILDKRFGEQAGGLYVGYQLVLVRGVLCFQMNDGKTNIFRSESGLVADGQWHHICVSVKRDQVQRATFYVDGKACGGFDTHEIGNTDSPATLNIGGHVDLDHHAFVGHIDEVRIYKRGLDAEDIIEIMNRTD